MSHEYAKRVRNDAASSTIARALGAAHRAALVLQADDSRVDTAIGVQGIARDIDTLFGLDARADIVRTCAQGAAKVAKPATAAHMTREVRSPDAPACRYADHSTVTGALKSQTMRVRRQGRCAPDMDAAGPRIEPGVGASQIEAARAQAIRTIKECAHMWANAKNGSVKRTVRDRLRAIVHVWGTDHTVCAALKWEGFDVARLR